MLLLQIYFSVVSKQYFSSKDTILSNCDIEMIKLDIKSVTFYVFLCDVKVFKQKC